ncbi:hypothetical protein QJS83_02320 [Bdellovibrio sp. 22V]|uniref:hypothetical protein n=1 Tax=Bdellovibrio sp. 22V TaxID=3044166 RepID=UPI0025430FE9|nr:hypothetical protein [Bdellovibrio sp. 22V]WII72704.1 hypothetical protein QJS83_02320 [Bdellovibrio sp. 22V]
MPHPLSLVKLPVFLFVYLIVNAASAQVYNSSISAATGGTGRAAVEAGDAAFLNPGTLVHLKGRNFFSSFAKDELAINISDSSPESFLPSALSFVKKKSDYAAGGDLQTQDFTLSLAEFVVDKLSLGVTGHYLTQEIPNATYHQINADFGLIYTPKSNIGWALVAYNVFGEKDDVPKELRQKTVFAGGFNYIYHAMVRFRVDVDSESVYMGGVETYINQFIITRLGYQKDADDDRELITAGAGFKGPRFALNYAYQGNTQNSEDYRHSVDLEIPF